MSYLPNWILAYPKDLNYRENKTVKLLLQYVDERDLSRRS